VKVTRKKTLKLVCGPPAAAAALWGMGYDDSAGHGVQFSREPRVGVSPRRPALVRHTGRPWVSLRSFPGFWIHGEASLARADASAFGSGFEIGSKELLYPAHKFVAYFQVVRQESVGLLRRDMRRRASAETEMEAKPEFGKRTHP
jgi:hypothetical protein